MSRRLLLLLLSLALGLPAPAWARPAAPGSADEGLAKRSELLLKRARKALHRGRYKEALVHLRKRAALAPLPRPDDYFNIAEVAIRARACDVLALYGQAWLVAAPRDPEAPRIRRKVDDCVGKAGEAGTMRFAVRPKEAMLTLDGIRFPRIPTEALRLPPGRHPFTLEAADHDPARGVLTLAAGETETLTIALKKQLFMGELRVKTVPAGAEVSIDGTARGKTPLGSVRLAEGKHFVEISMKGYDRFIRNVRVERSKTADFTAVLERTGEHVGAPPKD